MGKRTRAATGAICLCLGALWLGACTGRSTTPPTDGGPDGEGGLPSADGDLDGGDGGFLAPPDGSPPSCQDQDLTATALLQTVPSGLAGNTIWVQAVSRGPSGSAAYPLALSDAQRIEIQ